MGRLNVAAVPTGFQKTEGWYRFFIKEIEESTNRNGKLQLICKLEIREQADGDVRYIGDNFNVFFPIGDDIEPVPDDWNPSSPGVIFFMDRIVRPCLTSIPEDTDMIRSQCEGEEFWGRLQNREGQSNSNLVESRSLENDPRTS